jgi:hypothetical protein
LASSTSPNSTVELVPLRVFGGVAGELDREGGQSQLAETSP